MKNICDYTIIQRDSDGFGRGTFSGKVKPAENLRVVVRVVSEENGLQVTPWQEAVLNGDGWSADLTIPQGGLYRIEARQTQSKFDAYNNDYDWGAFVGCAHYVGVGDIFVMAGQSNMSGYGRDPACDPPELGVHLYDNSGNWVLAAHPLCTVVDPIYPNNDGASGNSPGLAFGKVMKRALGVPVGLVSACLGGSSLESWNPAEENCFLYNSMVEKVESVGKAAGIIWYQGCNETNPEECGTYLEKFTQSVGLWREKFGNLPIVTCQLNRHAYRENDNERMWAQVREAQRLAALSIPDVFIIPTNDLPVCDGIHNTSQSCVTVGERLAFAMLKGHYGLPGRLAPTVLEAVQLDDRHVLLKFDRHFTLKTMDNNPCGMNIEDGDGLMDCEKVEVCAEGLTVTGVRDIKGRAFFHAYWRKEQPSFTVRDVYGMPMLSCYNVEIKQK